MTKRAPAFLVAFCAAAVGLGMARALTTAYVPVLLDRIAHRPGLIGAVMLVNAAAGFAIPLATGVWSDRVRRRSTFIAGGAAVSAGGLVAIALGTASSYLVLALAAATVYVGLNAAATAHRALVAERFADDDRPRIVGAQELAMLLGALVGTVAGGALVDAAPSLLFGATAAAIAVLTVPTVALRMVREPAPRASRRVEAAGPRALLAAARTPGAREILLAQALWVFAYAALTPFMVLYAEHVLGIGAAVAGAVLAAFGLFTGAGMLVATRVRDDHVRPVLLGGVALLGGGLVCALPASTLAAAALPFAAAALGAGLVTALAFPYYARFIPDGEAGTYSGVFFSVRAVSATAALPVAGGLVATAGYRALLAQGGAALAGLVPLARARSAAAPERQPSRVTGVAARPVGSVAAVVPVLHGGALEQVVCGTLEHVDRVLVVDDGAPAAVTDAARALAARDPRVSYLVLGGNHGKGHALAAGIRTLVDGDDPPGAVLTLDADGQHPPDRIPAFVAAAGHADVVVGQRVDRRRGGMPVARRVANAAASAALSCALRGRLPDSQNGMRLLRTEALRRAPIGGGGFEAETRHLKRLVGAGLRVAWVPIPTIYAGESSSFRPVGDALRVLREIVRGEPGPPMPGAGALVDVVREWAPRLVLGMLAVIAVGLALPQLQATDERVFLSVNALGQGPPWLYDALDPHSRNYALLALLAVLGAVVLLRRARFVAGTCLAMILAAFAADAVLEVFQVLFDRERPEEVLGAEIQLPVGREWAELPSFPSGHLMVTAAMVVAAAAIVRRLRWPLFAYLALIALTRITFGAHFPLDVLVGAAIGAEVGCFSVALVRAAGLLPDAVRRPAPIGGPLGVPRPSA